MSAKQRRLLSGALLVAAAIALVPPWQRTGQMLESPVGRITTAEGHRPLFWPPRPNAGSRVVITYGVDYGRLLLYWTAIGLLTGVAWIRLRPSERSSESAAQEKRKT